MKDAIVDTAIHQQLAGQLFHAAWDLMDKPNRTAAEDEAMVHSAHASRYHWGREPAELGAGRLADFAGLCLAGTCGTCIVSCGVVLRTCGCAPTGRF